MKVQISGSTNDCSVYFVDNVGMIFWRHPVCDALRTFQVSKKLIAQNHTFAPIAYSPELGRLF